MNNLQAYMSLVDLKETRPTSTKRAVDRSHLKAMLTVCPQ